MQQNFQIASTQGKVPGGLRERDVDKFVHFQKYMANRHLSRSIAFQTLFEWDFNNEEGSQAIGILNNNIAEFAPGITETDYIFSLVHGVIEKQKTLDAIIEKAAPDWPIEKISYVDKNSLRIGLFELLYANRIEVPPKVAINEAIEIAKVFGGDTSGKFVNGVLGTVYKEIGEPGKNDSGKKNLDPSKFPVEMLGGALVYRRDGETMLLALVHDVFGYWTLSKGHIDINEGVEIGTQREIKEELGVNVEIQSKIGENEYIASDPEKGKIKKHVHYFLAETKNQTLHLQSSGGLTDAQWFTLSDIPNLKIYGDMLPLITKGIKELLHERKT
jgi:N utilization substance protein B